MNPDGCFEYMRFHHDVTCPSRASSRSASYDVHNPIPYTIPANKTARIPLHIAIKPPLGMYIRMTSSSELALTNKIITCADVIDPDYTGGIHVCVINLSEIDYHIKKGEKIASFVFEKYGIPVGREVLSMKRTERGNQGFGSTGC